MAQIISVLTQEFKLTLTQRQEFSIDRWLEQMHSVCNRAVGELLHFDNFAGYYNSEMKEYLPCCPLPWNYRTLYLDKNDAVIDKRKGVLTEVKEKIRVPYSNLLDSRSMWYQKKMTRVQYASAIAEGQNEWGWKSPTSSPGCTAYSCPLPRDYQPSILRNPRARVKGDGGLGQIIKRKNIGELLDRIITTQQELHQQDIESVPYKYMQAYIETLDTSWEEYNKSRYGSISNKIGKPRIKKHSDKLRTLIFCNSPNKGDRPVNPCGSDRLRGLPKLGIVKCKGLITRWRNFDGTIPEILSIKITKRCEEYFIQLTGKLSKNWKLNKKDTAIGIDPGVIKLLGFDSGKSYDNPRFLKKSEQQRISLEKQLADKRTHALILWLNHSDRTSEELHNISPAITLNSAQELLQSKPKNEKDIQQFISASCMNILKFRAIPKSKNIIELEQKIAKIHNKVKLQRRHSDQKMTTYIVRANKSIVIEDTQVRNMTRVAKPKLAESGTSYDKNNAAAKSGLNKSILDASFGRKRELLKQKCELTGREFYKVSAKYSSQECPVCKQNNIPDKDRMYRCACGWECDRDSNAGINFVLAAYDQGKFEQSSLSSLAKKALDTRMGWCEKNVDIKKTRKRRTA